MTVAERIKELKNLIEVLCENVSEQPAGCDACWLHNEDGSCEKEIVYEKLN